MRLDDFIKFLKTIDQKTASDDISPIVNWGGMSIALVLIGRYKTIRHIEENFNPYVSYIEGAASEGITSFYVLARGALNCFVADATVAETTKGNVIVKTNEYRDEVEYEGKKIPVLCIRLENLAILNDPVTVYQKSNLKN